MKKWDLYIVIVVIFCLVLLAFVILMVARGTLCYSVNIVELCSFIATTSLAIFVVYLTKSLEKKDTARDIITKDLLELCSTYESNVHILERLEKGELSLGIARREINMIFHRGDIITDMIHDELKESFPDFHDDIHNIVTPYWKWLTGGDLQTDTFQIDKNFQKDHETNLRNTIAKIRIVIHRLIKQS